MEMRKPFVALEHFLSDPQGAASLVPKPPVALPANAPPQVIQSVWQAVAQSALQSQGGAGVEVVYSIVNGLLESTRVAGESRTTGKISAFRNANSEIALAIMETEGSS